MNNTVLGRLLLGFLLIVIVVMTVVGLANLIGGGDDEAPEEDAVTLIDYDNDTSAVRYTLDGSVKGRDEHRQVRITVSQDQRIIELLEGYDGKVLERKTYSNDLAAYRVFLRSLAFEGFEATQEGTAGDDERGICPNGKRYIFELLDNNSEIIRNWRASCSVQLGTLAGDYRDMKRLFENQIPDYRDVTRGVRF